MIDVGEKVWIIPRRKTATYDGRGKGALVTTEEELIVEIPLIVRIRPIVVEPQPVLVAFELEDVRIAIRVGSVWRAIRSTACLE